MIELERARALMRQKPDSEEAAAIRHILVALESNAKIDVPTLFGLDYETFTLACALIEGWRLQQYTGIARNGRRPEGAAIDRRALPASPAAMETRAG